MDVYRFWIRFFKFLDNIKGKECVKFFGFFLFKLCFWKENVYLFWKKCLFDKDKCLGFYGLWIIVYVWIILYIFFV